MQQKYIFFYDTIYSDKSQAFIPKFLLKLLKGGLYMKVNVSGGTIQQDEINAYIKYGKRKYPNRHIMGVDINLDNDFVDLKFYFSPVKFERIRRITGYLVGTTDRFNNAKKAEVNERVKHSLS